MGYCPTSVDDCLFLRLGKVTRTSGSALPRDVLPICPFALLLVFGVVGLFMDDPGGPSILTLALLDIYRDISLFLNKF